MDSELCGTGSARLPVTQLVNWNCQVTLTVQDCHASTCYVLQELLIWPHNALHHDLDKVKQLNLSNQPEPQSDCASEVWSCSESDCAALLWPSQVSQAGPRQPLQQVSQAASAAGFPCSGPVQTWMPQGQLAEKIKIVWEIGRLIETCLQ